MEMVDIKDAKRRLKRIEDGLNNQSMSASAMKVPKWAYLRLS